MKALDEFGSVLVLAGLILGACVATEHLILMPDAGLSRTDRAYQKYSGAKSIAVAQRDSAAGAGSNAAGDLAAPANPDANMGAKAAPDLQVRVFQQARLSW